MITVLHGENQTASRKVLGEIRERAQKQGTEIVVIDGRKASSTKIELASQTQSLLGKTLVVVEDFFGGKKPVNLENLSGEIVFWESRELGVSVVNSFPKSWKIQSFPLSRSMFQFLDSLVPGNTKRALELLHQVALSETEYMLLPILAWHIRMLLWAQIDPKTLSGPAWKTGKLIAQAKKFDSQRLRFAHAKLLELDRKQKSGKLEISLLYGLDLLTIELLQ